ncbi:bifunctional UDP-N-acetylmuramoyl-tripeptide:D-alanyl-D-alanine ligase/alanine racemase [Algoriphagus sp. oki45]|uniref:bifunctional UDP-N-acetylmuramoyl-tripeptide:D-alanyl-D-alanine ligase/alanine racemase n=1 Tax=Algoriphagus sp. oki45 TaxID=3067294 RepID=UPI0027F72404|nr:bifunctional UDP-N-acetylmuramoyl-tripeptide:D-alanyl-D-alanine ligase/alanine racemase [Algoriphagus sp. oki45]
MIQALKAEVVLKITGGKLLGVSDGSALSQISIDSRQILQPSNTIFIALRGAKADGADYIPSLIQQGVRYFLVHEDFEPSEEMLSHAVFLQVKDTKVALQQLAAFQRSLFTAPVLSITGSNGKTITKEWLGQLLSQQFSVAKSPKSYNSQVGVPLSVFGIHPYHQVALLEAGISKVGEMATLEKIIRPDLGIFTNIGSAHEEGFSNLKEKIREKLILFQSSKFLIYCRDQELLSMQIEKDVDPSKLISWSQEKDADFRISYKKGDHRTRVVFVKKDLSTYTFQVPFSDQASLENATHALVAALTLGEDPKSIQQGLDQLRQVDMRLTLKPGINDCLLIDDTYNNDLAGLKVALEFMSQQRPKRQKVLILSDLLQQGSPEKIYAEVTDLVRSYRIDRILAVGQEIKRLTDLFPQQSELFQSTEELIESLPLTSFQNDLILVTGARDFALERIVNRLQQRIHGTTLEINLNALTHNFNFYKRQLKPGTRVMVMVKAFAYGGGATEIANHLQTLGADYLAVAFTDEGVTLRNQGIRLPIMVLNPVEESFDLLREYQLEPVVFSPSFFKKLGIYASNHNIQIPIHLDLDTGMHRLGFEIQHLQELKTLIGTYPELRIASLYTHLVGADEEAHHVFSIDQLEQFMKMKKEIESILTYRPLIHALNSAGIIRFPEYQMDMVRLGIGLYGVEVTGKHHHELKAVSTLKTTISQIKTLAPGSTVGYSRRGQLPNGGTIATLAIGYADGFDRRFSMGKGYVLIKGEKAPVIGNVCMDMTMVDISQIPEVREGEQAIIYGEGIPLRDLADRIGTIPYELLTNISSRVKRVYYLD